MAHKERIAKWDNMKLFLMFTVVLGHFVGPYMGESEALSGLGFFIYLFHIPAFFFISGLMSKKTIHGKRYDKIFPYLTLYLFVKLLIFCFSSIIFHNHSFNIFIEGGLPWFVLSLFFMNLITMFIQKCNPFIVLILSLSLSFFVGFCSFPEDFLAYMRTINFYPFFYLGYLIKPDALIAKLKTKKAHILSWFFVIFIFTICFLYDDILAPIRLLLSGRNPYDTLGEYELYGGFLRLAVSMITLILTLSIACIIPNIKNTFTRFGKRTLAIYSFHYCFFYIFFRIFHLDDKLQMQFPNIWPITFILLAILMTFLCANPIFDKITNFVMRWKLIHQRKGI